MLPRLAAQLDVSPISDIIGVKDSDTFIRFSVLFVVLTCRPQSLLPIGSVLTDFLESVFGLFYFKCKFLIEIEHITGG